MLHILTGTACVMFFVTLANAAPVVHVSNTADFLEGLRVANDVLSFGELHREEDDLFELLPWAGNV